MTDFTDAAARYLPVFDNDVVYGLVFRLYADPAIDIDNGEKEFAVKSVLSLWNRRVVMPENELKKKLFAIKIDGSSTDLASEYRNMVFPAVVKEHFFLYILVIADTDIRTGRREQAKRFTSQFGQGMINKL